MIALGPVLAERRDAVDRFIAAASRVAPQSWGVPIAPGKWSPGQISEHVALTYEEAASVLRGEPRAPSVPRWLRPVLRVLLLPHVLRTGRFPRGSKSPAAFRPSASPPPPPTTIARLRDAAARAEQEMKALADSGRATIEDPGFGRMRLADVVRLQTVHTLHHLRQLPGGH